MKKYRIVSIASEVAPFSKTGGLADVARSLPKSLKRLGHDVIVITPFYKQLIDAEQYGLKKIFADVPLHIAGNLDLTVSFWKGELMRGLPIYFVSADTYFGRKKALYGSEKDNQRFYIFDVAVLKLLLLLQFEPDIIHCHDWHTGLVPELLKKQFNDSESLQKAATVFTIHNLAFQLGHNWWEIPGPKRDRGITPLPDIKNEQDFERINFTKRAILHADVINAVSETYADEILQKNFGQDLHRILQNRKEKLFGVVNGIDYLEFDPNNDPGLTQNYNTAKAQHKLVNKETLQKRYKLAVDPAACVIIMTSRIAEQKGFDILMPIIPAMMDLHTQLVIMGDGDKEYTKQVTKYAKQYPKRIALASFEENPGHETMLYAGGDLSLFPSRFEPCGTNQLKSMRYGCIPVAREIGGLSDTVTDVDTKAPESNGFVFTEYNAFAFLAAIARAYAHFQHPISWKELLVRAMQQSNSWELPARKYVELYKKALKFKHNGQS
jgi:starch synthase